MPMSRIQPHGLMLKVFIMCSTATGRLLLSSTIQTTHGGYICWVATYTTALLNKTTSMYGWYIQGSKVPLILHILQIYGRRVRKQVITWETMETYKEALH